jgi:hypothetical protein
MRLGSAVHGFHFGREDAAPFHDGKVDGKSNFLVDHKGRILEKELPLSGPDRCPERFRFLGLRRRHTGLRIREQAANIMAATTTMPILSRAYLLAYHTL